MHKLLKNQLKRHKLDTGELPPDLAAFVSAVDEAYLQADEDRKLLERSLDLTSQELLERNAQLRRDIAERSRQERVQRDRAERLRLQNEALVELAKSHKLTEGDLMAAVRSITEMAARYLDVARVSVWLFSSDRSAISCIDFYDLYNHTHTDGQELRASEFPAYFHAIERHRTIAADSAQTHPDTLEFAESYLGPAGITSMLDASIRRGGRTLGVLCHEHVGAERDWSMEEELFAASLADMISLAMEGADRRRAEIELAQSLALLSATFESVADGILAVDHNKRVVTYNQRFMELWGMSEDLMASRECDRVIGYTLEHVKEPESFLATIHEVQSDPDKDSADVVELKDGRVFERVSRPQKIGGVSAGRVWSFRDITESRRAQEELLRAKRLEAAGQLAGQIAHDFNNLLTPLVAYPALMRRLFPVNEKSERVLREMEQSAKQIVDINQQLLTLGRRGHFNVEAFNPNELIEGAIRALDVAEGVQIDRQLASDLAPISGGPAQIMRVLTNLIANAIDAMGGFGKLHLITENVHLRGSLRRYAHVTEGEYVCIRIADSGSGIPLEIQEKIFEPFFSTKKTDKKRGSGLGLSVVHSVLEDHKGYIDLESEPGKGTTFSLYIPVDHNTKAIVPTPEGILDGNGATVLVVDDDHIQRDVVTTMLESLGYVAMALPSGEKAVAHMCTNECDLVVLDMVMDGIDGTETLRQIKILRPEQRAIILSGFARSDRVEEALRLGASAFVAKPVQTNVLAKAVQDALRSLPA